MSTSDRSERRSSQRQLTDSDDRQRNPPRSQLSKANKYQRYVSRRQMLAASGAAGVAALAGCMNDNEDEDLLDETDLDPVLEDVDYNENYEEEFEVVYPSPELNPVDDDYIFNPYHPRWNPGDLGQEFGFEYLTIYHTERSEYLPRIADDWSIDDDTLRTEVSLSEEYAWSTGEDITAHDFVTAYKLDGYMGLGMQDFVDIEEGIYAEDDYTLVIEPREEYSDMEEELWMTEWAETNLTVSEAQYGHFVEDFEEATTEDETQRVQESLINYEVSWDEVMYSGPWVFVEANEQFADQVPNPEHPIAQDWEFFQRTGMYVDEEGIQSGEVDWGDDTPEIRDVPDKYGTGPLPYDGQSFAIIFGNNDEYIRDHPEVRKAITYAVDVPYLTESTATDGTEYDEYSAGIDSLYVEDYVDADALDAMPNYAPQDTDRAAELLESVGFERSNGTWQTPEGDTWTLNFSVGNWFESHSEVISNNLQEFGIDVDHYVEEMPTWQATTRADLDFDLTVHLNYGQARNYHPYSDFDGIFNDTNLGLFTERTGIVEEDVEVPEVGNPDGDTVTFNIPAELEAMSTADSEEELVSHATNLAWVHNQLLPAAVCFPWGGGHYWVNTEDWNFDLESDDWLTSNRLTHYLLENGLERV
ncbi:ABC-type transport system substrate-binding protein [Halopiger aswanensis]|uniref:ABC-type transport system substrate-binding protein n=2 Tax=Halopiger aswanensis TaxID=148449 RepID=A0A419WJ88_9EURY|nr:ABC-type transport system substrate-binding protein [Halopiger aswanensis]